MKIVMKIIMKIVRKRRFKVAIKTSSIEKK